MNAVEQYEASPSVVVLGSVNIDTTLLVRAVPGAGETVLASAGRRGLGGKGANQGVAAARAGASVRLVGSIGDDLDGRDAVARLDASGVDTSGVLRADGTPTGAASVWLGEDHENRIVVLQGANYLVSPAQAQDAVASMEPDDVLVVQAEIPAETVSAALRAASARGVRVVLNLAPVAALGRDLSVADPLVVNEVELGQLLGARYATAADIVGSSARIRALARSVVVTLGSQGAVVVDDDGAAHVPAEPDVTVVDTTGAGDAFVGALAAGLGRGETLAEAARFASRCAAAAIGVLGAADAYPDFRTSDYLKDMS